MCFLIVSKRTDKTIVLFENNFCSVNSFPTANFNMMKHIVLQVFSLIASCVFDCMPNIDSDHAFFSKSLPAGTKLNEHLPGKEYFCVFFCFSGVTVCIYGSVVSFILNDAFSNSSSFCGFCTLMLYSFLPQPSLSSICALTVFKSKAKLNSVFVSVSLFQGNGGKNFLERAARIGQKTAVRNKILLIPIGHRLSVYHYFS